MNTPRQALVFISVALLVTATLHLYAWTRLVRDLGLRGAPRAALAVLFLGLFALLVAVVPLSRTRGGSGLVWAGYLWMGVLALLFFVLVFGDLLRGLWYAAGAPGVGFDGGRRAALGRIFGVASLGATGLLSGVSLWTALRRPAVKDVRVTLPRLPPGLSGLRIVQLTDLHIGPTIDGAWLREVVGRVNALQPDLVAITGDLVDGPVERLAADVAPLAELRARHGVFFVTGNHEYYSGVDAWLAHLGKLGIRVLRNERVTLEVRGLPLELAGVDDHHSGRFGDRFPGHGPDFGKAMAGRDPARPLLLLAHQPAAIREAAAHGVDLQLSGHTHGGQLWPWRFFVRLQQPYVSGLHKVPGGHTQIYVSNGTGYWGPPMRLAVPAEITHLTLLSA